jgi:uncharacterized membrane protein YfcA
MEVPRLWGLALASGVLAIVGLLSGHYYPALIALVITVLLIWATISVALQRRREALEASREAQAARGKADSDQPPAAYQ